MVTNLSNWAPACQRQMNTAPPVGPQVQNIGNNGQTMISNVSWMKKNSCLSGSETITYYNNSPDVLTYLWLQLDENEHSSEKNANYQDESTMGKQTVDRMIGELEVKKNDNGVNLKKITDALGKPLTYTVNKTMMRIDLPAPLKPGQKYIFKVDWSYKIVDRMEYGGSRGGYEYFPEDGNSLFTIAQWYPRLCVYSDFQGWQNHQFTGRGEFALTFGNFKVQMTVPADHMVGSTGECQNYQQVLTPTQFAPLAESTERKGCS